VEGRGDSTYLFLTTPNMLDLAKAMSMRKKFKILRPRYKDKGNSLDSSLLRVSRGEHRLGGTKARLWQEAVLSAVGAGKGFEGARRKKWASKAWKDRAAEEREGRKKRGRKKRGILKERAVSLNAADH